MKQYRITTRSYAQDHIPDAALAPDDLAEIKRLAGLGTGLLEDYTIPVPADAKERPSSSPVGSVGTSTDEKRQIEKQLNIKTGTPEWFRLYFARPELTGEKPVGDAPPEAERNPKYLLDKNGHSDADKVEKLGSELERKLRSSN
jgi:hypothetical protein